MIDPVRQEVIALAHTVVVKAGTNVRPPLEAGSRRPLSLVCARPLSQIWFFLAAPAWSRE
jgi:hypothetical protein